VLEVIYQDAKNSMRVNDYEDLAKKEKPRIQKLIKAKTSEPAYEDIAKVWDEVSFVRPAETEVERTTRNYIYEEHKIRQRSIIMRNRMKQMYTFQYPIERRVMEDRLAFLEKEYYNFEYTINPYHLQPGILLDVDITSIKRKKATLDAMANVLNEFLSGVSKGFSDAAFASFSRRRSTVREDLAQSFGGGEEDKKSEEVKTKADTPPAYLDTITAEAPASNQKAIAAPARQRAGAVDKKPRGRGRGAGKSAGNAAPARRGRAPSGGLVEV
jgi:hypothetical protein